MLGAGPAGEDCRWGGAWPVVPWVWLGAPPPVALPLSRVAPGVVADSREGVAASPVAPWVGEADASAGEEVFGLPVPGSCGSGEPGSSLRGASPGPGTTTRSASRTAPPRTEPTRRVTPATRKVTRAPRRRT